MTVIVDYGVGNLFSLESALKQLGFSSLVSGDPQVIRRADRILLPGVGAFRDARERLRVNGLDELLRHEADAGKPLMGICLGMQLLFERSYEYGIAEGLGIIPGEVRAIADVIPEGYKVPHIGWNALDFGDKGPDESVFKYISEGDYVYFVHSFAAMDCIGSIIATTDYGAPLTAAVHHGNTFGMQFHPEKSGVTGLNILKAFCEL